MRGLTAVFIAACVFLPASSAAQTQPGGLWLNAHLNGSSFRSDGVPDELGGGMGVGIGYAFTRSVMLFVHVDGAAMAAGGGGPDYTLGHADLGFRISAPLGSWFPYLLVAGTTRMASWTDVPEPTQVGIIYYDVTARGIGGSVGLGMQKMMSRRVGLDGAVIVSTGTFTNGEVQGRPVDFENFNAESGRVVLGLSWYPRGR